MSADQKSPTQASRNSLGIRYVEKGPIGLKTVLNQIISGMDMLYPRPSADIAPSVSADGTVYRLKQALAQRGALEKRKPFELYAESYSGTLKISVFPGYLNGVMPTLGGTSLNATPPPTATITATTWVWLKCVATFGAPDTYVVTVESTSTSPPPTAEAISGTGFTSCLLIGIATVSGGAITTIDQLVSSNLKVESYGNINDWGALS